TLSFEGYVRQVAGYNGHIDVNFKCVRSVKVTGKAGNKMESITRNYVSLNNSAKIYTTLVSVIGVLHLNLVVQVCNDKVKENGVSHFNVVWSVIVNHYINRNGSCLLSSAL